MNDSTIILTPAQAEWLNMQKELFVRQLKSRGAPNAVELASTCLRRWGTHGVVCAELRAQPVPTKGNAVLIRALNAIGIGADMRYTTDCSNGKRTYIFIPYTHMCIPSM